MKKTGLIIVLIVVVLLTIVGFGNIEVNAMDKDENFVIVLDPGHGENDPGASNSKYGLQEAKINYQIAVYAKEELEKYARVKVYLTRYDNCPTIKERAEFAKNYNADLLVSIHINSLGNTQRAQEVRGAEIWVTQDNTKPEYYQKSKELGDKILNQIQKLGIPNRGVSTRSGKPNEWYDSGVVKDYYGIIRYARDYKIRSILVEHCYISNDEDCKFINSNEKLKKLGIANANGIAEMYNLSKGTAVKGITLDKEKLNLEVDDEYKFKVTFNPSNSLNRNVKWTSSKPDIVQINENGIKAMKAGTSVVTAITEDGNKTASCTVTVTGTGEALTFNDVKKADWFYKAVKFAYEKGIIKGYNKNQFGPQDKVTRGQLVTMLYRLEKEPDTKSLKNNFEDVKEGEYYTNAVKWANANGIVKGYGGTKKFGPNDPIIRQDLAIILNRFYEYKGKTKTNSNLQLTNFKDYKTVSDYALASVKWTAENGIITGQTLPDGSKQIAPLANTTRAEVSTMLMRYIEKFCKEDKQTINENKTQTNNTQTNNTQNVKK